jgi:P-type conjugative transfer protein TrbL
MTDFGTLDTVLNNFTGAISSTWGPQLFFYLQPLLFTIIVLQFGLVALEATVQRDVPLLLSHMMMGLFRIGVVWAIFTYGFTWANSIIQTGQVLGSNISGFGLTPSGVFDEGINIMMMIWNAKASAGWLTEIIQFIEFFFAALFVILCWTVASVIYLGCLIEAALLVYVGPLIIAFTPLSWTFEILLLWGRSLLGLAFRLALILMTLAIGMALANNWTSFIADTSSTFSTNIWNLLLTIVEAIVFAVCVWRMPNRIRGLTAGAATIGFGEGVLGMAAAGAGAAYGALRGGSGSSNSNSSGSASSGCSPGGAGSGGNNGGGQQAAQQMAAKVQSALTQG